MVVPRIFGAFLPVEPSIRSNGFAISFGVTLVDTLYGIMTAVSIRLDGAATVGDCCVMTGNSTV